MNDVMVDLETMDNLPSAGIVSIGAVQCNLTTGEVGSTYYRVVDLAGQQEKGLTISTSTMYWWMGQSDGARQALLVPGKITLEAMCTSFSKWLTSFEHNGSPISPERLRLWGNGASFDNAILRHAFAKCGQEFPIPFWQDRDMRTIVGFYPPQLAAVWKRNNLRKGHAHNAMDDAKYQVEYCANILQELGVKELY